MSKSIFFFNIEEEEKINCSEERIRNLLKNRSAHSGCYGDQKVETEAFHTGAGSL
jgi:hypothetical protein